ncbi:calycin-like domain-containing protein [Bacteroides sp. UBA939]|uniref:calycin-like domain-containing protein n=1 Tax=Bacteroides sp. UBA939 TaxID=1946092 RepID=UPI0025C1B418|nr:calycin-like domain-containing protein [Bacteroides sp. UBA939]
MKKSIFYLFAVVCTVCLFAACGDDDEKVLTVNDIAGTYSGTLTVVGLGEPTPGTSMYLTKVSDSKVKLELKNFGFSGMSLGNIEVECDAVLDGDKMDISGSASVSVPPLGNFPVEVDGDSDGTTLNATISIATAPLPAGDVTVTYAGTK